MVLRRGNKQVLIAWRKDTQDPTAGVKGAQFQEQDLEPAVLPMLGTLKTAVRGCFGVPGMSMLLGHGLCRNGSNSGTPLNLALGPGFPLTHFQLCYWVE